MKRAFLFIFFLQTFLGFSQIQTECEKILSQKINLDFAERSDLDVLNNNFSKLKDCGLEEDDVEFLANGPILASLLIPMVSETEGNVTYQNLFDKVLELKQSPQYKKSKEFFKISMDLSKRSADIDNWEVDKKLLEALETPQETIESFHDYLKENSNPSKTYAEIFSEYKDERVAKEKSNNIFENEYEDGIFKNQGNVNYEELLQKSIELKKPLLLYFTGYACVNCRKMEESVLSDQSIKEQLKNKFYFVNLYVDDKSALPKNQWVDSKVTNKTIKTVGNKNLELQMLKFKVNAQPYFVIIDNSGSEIESRGYTPDIKLFTNFLNTVE